MRVAVCFSGQPRTLKYCVKSLLSFFDGADFFCHVWDFNSFKQKDPIHNNIKIIQEYVPHISILEGIQNFAPKFYVLESEKVLNKNIRFPWDNMLYSNMMAINLKKNYEIENNIRYDLVIKARYDLVFPPNKKCNFEEMFNNIKLGYPNYDLYTSHTGRMPSEYNRINISDVLYYGSSTAMDIVGNLYWHVKKEISKSSIHDMNNLGPGTWMSDFICTNNLRFYEDWNNTKDTIYRYDAIPLDSEKAFLEIQKIHGEMYK